MKNIYLDNAATTAIRPEVITEMTSVMNNIYGNPSSTHSFGRSAKSIVESARKTIASNLNVSAAEIIFTSGGTEANNWAIRSAVLRYGIRRIVSSDIEHHSVLESVEKMSSEFSVHVDKVKIFPDGHIDFNHLAELLSDDYPTLVTLMHVNNEIGTVLDLKKVGSLCKQYKALFHTDAVQSVGKTEINLKALHVDFLSASAHKFHGPKGTGFLFVKKGLTLDPMIVGGEQEKGLRAGTESVHNIAGMSKAIEIAYENLPADTEFIMSLKDYLIARCVEDIPGFSVNGDIHGFFNIINVRLPFDLEKAAMMLFNLDIKGIAVSRGSACQSGSLKPSHVLAAISAGASIDMPSIRISFSHSNTKEEIDTLIAALKAL